MLEKDIDTLFQQIVRGERRGRWAARIRRILAYVLKLVAAGGSLVVATGYLPKWNQPIGAAILIAVLLDTVSSNHTRLLAEVKAGYAFEFLRERISREYNRSFDPIVKQLQEAYAKNKPADIRAGNQARDALQQKTHRELTEGIQNIREGLAAADLKALETLALDNERAAAMQVVGSTPKNVSG